MSVATPPLRGLIRNIEGHYSKYQFSVVVGGIAKNIAKRRFAPLGEDALHVRMVWHGFLDGLQDTGEVAVSVENDDGNFCIAPTQVAEKLVNRFHKNLLAGPKLTLRDEDVLAVYLKIDRKRYKAFDADDRPLGSFLGRPKAL